MDIAMYLESTRHRLRLWGHWYHFLVAAELGFSKKSLISELIVTGGVMVKGTNRLFIRENKDAEAVDTWVNQLAKQKPRQAKVLKLHYTSMDPIDEKTASLGISRRHYFRTLKLAEKWMHRCLKSHED